MSSRGLDDTDDGGSFRELDNDCGRVEVTWSVVGMNEDEEGEE